ncbi:MAG TPA: hypothetical protein VEW03_06015, partial [Longimicrobiaceae bacterium]|nr:hypothetical protein [Longimicrobiaceae bacterium]
MSSPGPTPSLRLTGTQLAQYFRFRCERQLRYALEPGGEGVPAGEVRPGMGLLRAAGRRFERQKLAALVRRFGEPAVLCAGYTPRGDALPLDYARVVAALRDPGEVRFLVQPQLHLRDPAAFAARFGFDAGVVEIATAQPDLVRVERRPDGRLRLGVIDVKWSSQRAVHHFAQVAFYTLLLEEVVRTEGLDAEVETRWGWVWSRGGRAPRRFALAAYRHHVEAFLRDELPRIAAAGPAAAAWHLGPVCAGCGYLRGCREEGDRTDDLARVPGLTPLARQVLHGRGIHTVGALTRAAHRRETYTGCHALETGETSLRQRAQALAFRKLFDVEKQTHLVGDAERVRVFVTAEGDPVSGTVFALGLRVEGEDGGGYATEIFLSAGGSVRREGEMLRSFLVRAGELAGRMLAGGGEADARRGPKPVHVFVFDRAELELLRGVLQRHAADPAAQPGIAALAGLLFPSGGRGMRAAPAAPGTVLLDAVAELFALPVPYAWDLGAVSAALRPAEREAVHRPAEDYAWPFSSQVAFERIHNVWRRRPHRGLPPDAVRGEIERVVRSKLAALDSVLRAVREHASRSRLPRLRLEGSGGAPGTPVEPISDPTLEALRI